MEEAPEAPRLQSDAILPPPTMNKHQCVCCTSNMNRVELTCSANQTQQIQLITINSLTWEYLQ